jgi:hypothetical protein
MYINIKDCKVGKKYRFDKHWHTVADEDINLSYMTGTCVLNKIFKNQPKILGEHEQYIYIKIDKDVPAFQGEFENKAMFCFPHDHQYLDVKVIEDEHILPR